MGWWTANKNGGIAWDDPSSAVDAWGDSVADIMDAAITRIVAEFELQFGRRPTLQELQAGLEFSAQAFDLPSRKARRST